MGHPKARKSATTESEYVRGMISKQECSASTEQDFECQRRSGAETWRKECDG